MASGIDGDDQIARSKPVSLTIGPDDDQDDDDDTDLVSNFAQWQQQKGSCREQRDRCSMNSELLEIVKQAMGPSEMSFRPMTDQFDTEIWHEKPPKIQFGLLFGDILGQGSYGKVKECLDERTLVRKAVKIIKDNRLMKIPGGRAHVVREMRLLRRVRHEHVIGLLDVFRNVEKQKLYLVFEYCVGSLQQMVDHSPGRRLPPIQAHGYFKQLIRGLQYLHSQDFNENAQNYSRTTLGIIHKDIKPGNLLLSLDETLKIIDFGVAEELDRFSRDDWCRHGQGTPKFQAPEVISGLDSRFRGRPVDVWACGVTLYNLISSEYPFGGDVLMHLYHNIAEQPLHLPDCICRDDPLHDLLTRMLDKNPLDRIAIDAICCHCWFRRRPSMTVFSDIAYVSVPAVNNAPAHRPLSLYGPLRQMYAEEQEREQEREQGREQEREQGRENIAQAVTVKHVDEEARRKKKGPLCIQS